MDDYNSSESQSSLRGAKREHFLAFKSAADTGGVVGDGGSVASTASSAAMAFSALDPSLSEEDDELDEEDDAVALVEVERASAVTRAGF